MAERIVIVGAGQAAVACAARLRALSADSLITVIGSETHLPYQRPPLSKAFLAGELTIERLALRPQTWFADQRIELRTGETVTAIDRDQRLVRLAGGERLAYDRLVLATGSRARELPASLATSRSYTLRGIDDALRLRDELQEGRRVLVIGGGYVGLEFAASASKAGLKVTLVEAGPRILGRVAAPQTAEYFRALHLSRGVEIREGVGIQSLSETVDGIQARLSDGQELCVDFVLAGIGALANDELAQACGLACDNGVLVDELCRSSDPAIYAVGDCATVVEAGGNRRRIESVHNAIEQGETAASAMLGLEPPAKKTPWFWSDQYECKLQIAGLNQGYDRIEVKPGNRPGAQSVWYYAGEQLLAVDAINDPVTYMKVRRDFDAQISAAQSV
nr:pyridine nucleotide-disulfide oxidoreductase [Gammaproteobacteria bacterium]